MVAAKKQICPAENCYSKNHCKKNILLITWTQDQKPREEAGHAEQKLSIE
jgi:hypothetical protein